MTFARLLLCAAAAGGLSAQGAGPLGTVTTIDGRTFTGAFAIGAANDVVITGSGEPVRLGLDEVAAFASSIAKTVASPPPHRLWLRSGLELAVAALYGVPAEAGKPARVAAELAVGATVELPISTLRAIRYGGPEREKPASFAADFASPPDNTDLLYVQKDGKQFRFQVTISGMRRDFVDFDLRGDARDYELAGVVAIVFGNNTGFAADPQRPPRAIIDFDTGDHLEGRVLGLGEHVRLRLDEGAEVTIPSARIARIAVESDRLQWLSDFVPEAEQTPAFDRVWPWTTDRSVAGPGFELGGKNWSRGIGMVPRTRLTYDLGGKYDVFEAMIGIDDRGGPQAHAIFRVLVDGQVVFESGAKTRGMPAEAVRVELNKCQRLAIEVDFGKNYDLGDYCVFADARVLLR